MLHDIWLIYYVVNFEMNFSLKIEPMQAEDVADDEETGSDEGRRLSKPDFFIKRFKLL